MQRSSPPRLSLFLSFSPHPLREHLLNRGAQSWRPTSGSGMAVGGGDEQALHITVLIPTATRTGPLTWSHSWTHTALQTSTAVDSHAQPPRSHKSLPQLPSPFYSSRARHSSLPAVQQALICVPWPKRGRSTDQEGSAPSPPALGP